MFQETLTVPLCQQDVNGLWPDCQEKPGAVSDARNQRRRQGNNTPAIRSGLKDKVFVSEKMNSAKGGVLVPG